MDSPILLLYVFNCGWDVWFSHAAALLNMKKSVCQLLMLEVEASVPKIIWAEDSYKDMKLKEFLVFQLDHWIRCLKRGKVNGLPILSLNST